MRLGSLSELQLGAEEQTADHILAFYPSIPPSKRDTCIFYKHNFYKHTEPDFWCKITPALISIVIFSLNLINLHELFAFVNETK